MHDSCSILTLHDTNQVHSKNMKKMLMKLLPKVPDHQLMRALTQKLANKTMVS